MIKQWWLVFVLLGVDATLDNGCRIQQLHSFREVKYLQGCSKTSWNQMSNQE